MKTVSVPTLQEVEVATCDICGKDVGDYRWWISMEIDDGCMGEIIKTLQYIYNGYTENIKGVNK